MRRPKEVLSQRQLIDEIRFLLDTTCEDCRHARCARNTAALLTMVGDNPTSTFSTKVMYNIGVRRYTRLTHAIGAAQPAARGPNANSMRRTRSFENLTG